jgi:hypothetical protein
MFRDDISAYSEPPRPRRKTTPWVPITLVALVCLGLAHVAGLTKPLKSMAVQLTGYGRTPGSRLLGNWESDDDPMFRRICHSARREDYCGTGLYLADAGNGMREVIFRITAEDRSGRHVEMSEFLPGANENYRVRYSIAEDGRSMTREYDDRNGIHVSCKYRYLGPSTQSAP